MNVLFVKLSALLLAKEIHKNASDVLISDLMKYLKENGAFVNPKVTIKRVGEALGLFAMADMKPDEVICHIPPHLIIMPKEGYTNDSDDCSTIQAVYEMLREEEPNPWARYLQSLTPRYTPEFWSEDGKSLLKEMASDNLPPQYIDDTLEELKDDCQGDISDQLYLHAAFLVKSRADYSFLVPFYDMTNHHNGKLNMQHVYNPFKDDIKETGYAIATTQRVSAGQQLFNSYNQCNIVCQDYYDWFGTPELFQAYGFVEPYPQRWLFDLARIKLELNIDEKGEEVVEFLVPPSKKGIDMLKIELERLDEFSKKYRSTNMGVPKNEWTLLWEYFDALHNALSRAIESDVPLSEEIWEMHHDWWVKDGSQKEYDVDEHYVRRSI